MGAALMGNRTMSKHENRITILENEVGFLKNQIKNLIEIIRKRKKK